MKGKRKKYLKTDHKLTGFIILSVLFTAVFLVSIFISQNNKITLLTKAEEDCSGHTGDFGQNPCKWSCNIQLNGNPVNIPSCCDEIAQTGDSTKCVFDARRMCTPAQCGSVTGARNRCAQLWEVGCCPVWTEGCALKPPPEMLSLAPAAPSAPPGPTKPSSLGPPPFVGCVDAGDWLCMCPNGDKYFYDCANYESQPKKDYIALCGDEKKGELQWRYDMAKSGTGNGSCCGGQNVCRPAVQPTSPYVPPVVTPVIPINSPIPTTNNPSPPLGVNPQPTTYIPPTQAPIDDYNPQPRPTDDRPLVGTTPNLQPTTYNQQRIIPNPKRIMDNIAKSVDQFIQKTQNTLRQFFATILP